MCSGEDCRERREDMDQRGIFEEGLTVTGEGG